MVGLIPDVLFAQNANIGILIAFAEEGGASDAAGRLFYLYLLHAGTITKGLALADIAISPENTTASVDVLMGLYESSDGQWGFLQSKCNITNLTSALENPRHILIWVANFPLSCWKARRMKDGAYRAKRA